GDAGVRAGVAVSWRRGVRAHHLLAARGARAELLGENLVPRVRAARGVVDFPGDHMRAILTRSSIAEIARRGCRPPSDRLLSFLDTLPGACYLAQYAAHTRTGLPPNGVVSRTRGEPQ